VGWLIGWAGSIVVQMAIIGGLYQAGFGKGALIWLLAIVFSFLLSCRVFPDRNDLQRFHSSKLVESGTELVSRWISIFCTFAENGHLA